MNCFHSSYSNVVKLLFNFFMYSVFGINFKSPFVCFLIFSTTSVHSSKMFLITCYDFTTYYFWFYFVLLPAELTDRLESFIKEDNFVITLTHVKPRRRLRGTENLFSVDFPNTLNKFSVLLNRQQKRGKCYRRRRCY